MKHNFPSMLYVVLDKDSNDTIADEDPGALAYVDESYPMARYVLAGTGEVTNGTQYIENNLQQCAAQHDLNQAQGLGPAVQTNFQGTPYPGNPYNK